MMQYRVSSSRRAKRSTRRNLILTAALAAASLSPALFFTGEFVQDDAPRAASSINHFDQASMQAAAATAPIAIYDRALIDPVPMMPSGTPAFTRNTPLEATLRPSARPREASVAALTSPVQPEPPQPSVVAAAQAAVVPLPVPRPRELRPPNPAEGPKVATAHPARQVMSAAGPIAPADDRSFIEKLFGVQRPSPPASALGYAALEGPGTASLGNRSGLGTAPAADSVTAVYDISAQVVFMPNGERLEAHSGLGNMLDDPRYVHIRMRGSTPPGTYTLTERERLFHGVRAIRLNPVGGSAAIHGRDGLLAHTYLLGPNGDSNGCVSFKNYDRFLQAYLRGEVKRLVVIAGRKQDALPRMVNSRSGMPHRS